MKKTRKAPIFIVIAVFVLITVFSAGIFAAETPKFVISSATADPGEKVSITISIVNNPGVASARLFVSFDSALTLESITYGENIGGMTQLPQKYTSPVVLNWISAFAELKTDEIYATLVFSVSKDAAGGNHPITLKYDEDDVYNFKEDNVYFGIENGGIFVIREAEPTTASAAEATTATVEVTTAQTTEATTVATTAETSPTQTNATYPTATTAGTTQGATSTQQAISTAETTTAETRPSESTAASTISETTTASRTEPTQTATTAAGSTSTVPSESVAETTETAETKPSESIVPTPEHEEKSSATVPIVIAASIAFLFIAAFAVYVIKNKKIR